MKVITSIFIVVIIFINSYVSGEIVEIDNKNQEIGDPAIQPWDIEKAYTSETTSLNFETNQGTWISVDISPDGTTMVFDLLGHIYQMPVTGGDAKALTRGRSWNNLPRYSPDGKKLAFTSDRGGSEDIWTMVLATGELKNISKRPKNPVYRPDWSQDGRFIYGSAVEFGAKFGVGYRYSLVGQSQLLIPNDNPAMPLTNLVEDNKRKLVYFEHRDRELYRSGVRIKSYDLESGEIKVEIERGGSAFNPTLSPDGRTMVYGHRDNLDIVLVLRDLNTHKEKILVRGLDRDHQDYRGHYLGSMPNISWHPNGKEIFFSKSGKISAVNIKTEKVRNIPFKATIDRLLNKTVRFKVDLPEKQDTTLAHRWAQKTGKGILFESLGDLYLKADQELKNLTKSDALESSPVYDPASAYLYYSSWTDKNLGSIYKRKLKGGKAKRLTEQPSVYGPLTLSKDGSQLAFLRDKGDLLRGKILEAITDFELVIINIKGQNKGKEIKIADVTGRADAPFMPHSIRFGPNKEYLYYTDMSGTDLLLQRINLLTKEKKTLYNFSKAVWADLSPGLKWIAVREYHRSYITPFEFAGKTVSISPYNGKGFAKRVDNLDGVYMSWSVDGSNLSWSRGGKLYEKSVVDILAKEDKPPVTTDLAFEYEIAIPESNIALTHVRLITMNGEKDIFEDVTLLIKNNRISAVGADINIPSDTKIYDLSGQTVIPGLVDSHAHYNGSHISQSGQIPQRDHFLAAGLSYGVTTMVELYGTAEKDFWVIDMLKSGKMEGPRLFSVGAPLYGEQKSRPGTFIPIDNYQDADAQVAYHKDSGATVLKDYLNITRDVRHQYITAARKQGMNIVAESAGNFSMNLTQIIDGITGIEHAMGQSPLYQDIIELFKATNVAITPTLLVVYNGPYGQSYFNQTERVWENTKLQQFSPKEELLGYRRLNRFYREDEQYAREMGREMKKLFDAGVLVNMGGHGQMRGLDAHWEMELLVQGGFSEHDALQTATINGATYHGLNHQLGSIEIGKLADLVILKKNPLDDIRNTRMINYVMKNGVLYNGENGTRVYPSPEPAELLYFKDRELREH